ncbi:diguanylate cyclase domain-containing protein [Alishewanella longhuensis]
MLLKVADCMRETLRATDSLFRFGGDEFAVLLTDSDAEHAERVAERYFKCD